MWGRNNHTKYWEVISVNIFPSLYDSPMLHSPCRAHQELTFSIQWSLRDFSKPFQPVVQKCPKYWDCHIYMNWETALLCSIITVLVCLAMQLFLHTEAWISALSITCSCKGHWCSYVKSPCPVRILCSWRLGLESYSGAQQQMRIWNLWLVEVIISVWAILMSAQVCIKQSS